MSNVKNISKVYLLSVPLENDYKNTLFFDNKTHQEKYFKSRIVARFSDFNYQRKEGTIKIPDRDDNGLSTSFDDLLALGVNYVMYQNTAHSNKWFYAFITDIRYFSEGKTDIDIETDVLQTWYFNYNIKESFVEREHVDDDTIGLHTMPENLETGEYICNSEPEKFNMGENYIIVATTYDGNENVTGSIYSGVYSGVRYKAYKWSEYAKVNEFLKGLAGGTSSSEGGKSEAVSSIFLCPGFIVEDLLGSDNNLSYGTRKGEEFKEIAKNYHNIDGYVPKNRKLFCHPFNYLLASNNSGGSAIYRYEDFENIEAYNGNCPFHLFGVVTPGCSIKLVPAYYKGVYKNMEESLNAGKFPICNWNTDVYTNWLVQNSSNIKLSLASGAVSIASGAMTLNAEAVSSGLFGIANVMAQKHQQSLVPPQAEGNINSGDITTSLDENTITFYPMCIKSEYAKIIDKYFDMFGYQVNMVKKPNYNHRNNYWYTKTIDINIDGSIPMMDLQKIKDCYNKGITFWRNPDRIQDYSVTNGIL